MSTYAKELLDRDKLVRKGKGEIYVVIHGEYDDAYVMAGFEAKADAIKLRDNDNLTVTSDHDRARLDTIPFYPTGTYNE